jgi:hypothetical protein
MCLPWVQKLLVESIVRSPQLHQIMEGFRILPLFFECCAMARSLETWQLYCFCAGCNSSWLHTGTILQACTCIIQIVIAEILSFMFVKLKLMTKKEKKLKVLRRSNLKWEANSVHDVHQTCCGDKHIKRICSKENPSKLGDSYMIHSNVMNNFISGVNCRPYQ